MATETILSDISSIAKNGIEMKHTVSKETLIGLGIVLSVVALLAAAARAVTIAMRSSK